MMTLMSQYSKNNYLPKHVIYTMYPEFIIKMNNNLGNINVLGELKYSIILVEYCIVASE